MHEVAQMLDEFLDPYAGGHGRVLTFRALSGGTFADGRVTGATESTIKLNAATGGPDAFAVSQGLAQQSDLYVQVSNAELERQSFDPDLKWSTTIDGAKYEVISFTTIKPGVDGISTVFRMGKI